MEAWQVTEEDFCSLCHEGVELKAESHLRTSYLTYINE